MWIFPGGKVSSKGRALWRRRNAARRPSATASAARRRESSSGNRCRPGQHQRTGLRCAEAEVVQVQHGNHVGAGKNAGNKQIDQLVRLLADYRFAQQGVYALYPDTRHLPLKVRAFIDFMKGWG